jgi:hypothetical protein
LNAILWDGNKQLHGFLEFTDIELIFRLKDFSDTNLHLVLKFVDITKIAKYKLYNFSNEGIEICSKEGKRNVFVVEDVDILKKEISINLPIKK